MKTIPTVQVSAVVDIATLAADGKTGVKLPKGFVYTGVAVKESVKANGTAATATIKAGSTGIAAAFNIGGDAAIDAYKAATTPAKLAAAADLVVTLGGTTASTTGVLEVVVVGIVAEAVPTDAATVSAGTNVAPADTYTPPEKK